MTDKDDHLLRAALGGDAEAFCGVAERHEKWLFQRAYAMCRDHHLAEDLTQETMLEAWKSRSRYNGRCRFSTWLYSILLHRHKKSRRKARLVPLPESDLRKGCASESKNIPGASDALSDPGGDAPAIMKEKERNERLRAGIDRLPEPMRAVILMHFFAHAPLAEISEALAVPLGTVKSRLHYGLEKLREKCDFP